MVLSSANVGKHEFLPGKDVSPEKKLLEDVAIIKRFEYSLLGSELKKQAAIPKDKYNFFKDQINVNWQRRRWEWWRPETRLLN